MNKLKFINPPTSYFDVVVSFGLLELARHNGIKLVRESVGGQVVLGMYGGVNNITTFYNILFNQKVVLGEVHMASDSFGYCYLNIPPTQEIEQIPTESFVNEVKGGVCTYCYKVDPSFKEDDFSLYIGNGLIHVEEEYKDEFIKKHPVTGKSLEWL